MTAATATATTVRGLDVLRPISLAEIDATVALQSRHDRKYVVRAEVLAELIGLLGAETRVLEIDGARSFGYESLYFDTAEFDSYLGAARRRPDRFKVRTRTYLDTGRCWFEVKVRSRHGQTVKHRQPHDVGRRRRLTAGAIELLTRFPQIRPFAPELRPVLRTTYQRATLVCADQRVTVDAALVCAPAGGPGHGGVGVGVGDAVIVETKSERDAGPADRALWSLGVRPVTISKFGIGLASVHPGLPANRWHRTLDRHVTPARRDGGVNRGATSR